MNNTTQSIFTTRRVVIALVVIALAFFWWRSGRAELSYETAVIQRGNIEAVVAAIGTLSPRHSVEVGAQVSGQIMTLAVTPGSTVEKDQLLVEIDASLQQSTVDAGRAQLAGQRAQLASRQASAVLTKQQYQRQQQLAKDEATREEDVQTATANWKKALASVAELKAQIEQTQSRLKGDEASLGYTRIYAPMSGTVISVVAKQGQTLNATYSTPIILTIADLSTMTVEAEVAEADVRQIKASMPVWFTALGNDSRRWHGKVRQVLPSPIDPAAEIVFYTVLFEVDNADGELMSGMTAQVSFVTEQAEDVLLVPLSAIEPSETGEETLYTVNIMDADGELQQRLINIGRQDILFAEVLSGIKQGDNIVVRELSGVKH